MSLKTVINLKFYCAKNLVIILLIYLNFLKDKKKINKKASKNLFQYNYIINSIFLNYLTFQHLKIFYQYLKSSNKKKLALNVLNFKNLLYYSKNFFKRVPIII